MPKLSLLSVLVLSIAVLGSCAFAPPMPPGAFIASSGPAEKVQPSNDFTFSLGILDRVGGGFAANSYPVAGTAKVDDVEYRVVDVDLAKLLVAPDGTATRYIGSDGRIYRAVLSPETTTFASVSAN